MSSMASTFSPNSLQLRFALNSKIYRLLPPVRGRLTSWDRYAHTICALQCGNGVEQRRVERQWIVSCSAADDFAGWTDSNGSDQSAEPERKNSLQGMKKGLCMVTGSPNSVLILLIFYEMNDSAPWRHTEPGNFVLKYLDKS